MSKRKILVTGVAKRRFAGGSNTEFHHCGDEVNVIARSLVQTLEEVGAEVEHGGNVL